jgi:hypothetical protein
MDTLSDEALRAILDQGFDFIMGRKVADFVDADWAVDVVSNALTRDRIVSIQKRYTLPSRNRLRDKVAKSELVLSEWLPNHAVEQIAVVLGEPAPLPEKMVDDLVSSERVREEVRATLTETLQNFIAKATFAGDEKSNPLRGALSRGALGIAAAGKSLFGGIGEQIQKQLQDRVRDFVDGSVAIVQGRIADRLKSKETGEYLGRRRREVFLRMLRRSESEAVAFLDTLGIDKLDRLMPEIVEHNLRRPELKEAVRAEIQETTEELSKQTIGELLDELGLRDQARDLVRAKGLPVLRAFVAAGGLEKLMTAMMPGAQTGTPG